MGNGWRFLLLTGPPGGAALLAALAAREPGLYRELVQEDSVLEWAQVGLYVGAAALALASGRNFQRAGRPGLAVGWTLIALGCALAAGEELSWGQRLVGFETPESLEAINRQEEATLHNVGDARPTFDFLILLAGAYGALAPWLARAESSLVPPRILVPAFATVAVYQLVRLVFMPAPDYRFAKLSEWPELCLALAIFVFAHGVRRRSSIRNPRL